MKRVKEMILSVVLCIALSSIVLVGLSGCGETAPTQEYRPKHVVFIGIDAMGSYGLERAYTPRLNELMLGGAYTLTARSVFPTVSSPNWMSMVSAAPIQVHGVTSNDWEPGLGEVQPPVTNKKGLYPTVFDLTKTQHPSKKVHVFYEWQGQDRMYDMSEVDVAETGKNGVQTFQAFAADFLKNRPDFTFLSIDAVDYAGHYYGHETEGYFNEVRLYDSLIGDFVDSVRAHGLLEETVIMVAADHGGIADSHGGDRPQEYTIPIILYGANVVPGTRLPDGGSIMDVGATLADLLDVKLHPSAQGKALREAFYTTTRPMDSIYTMPWIAPYDGIFMDSVEVTIVNDSPHGKVYYTIDGTTPTLESTPYTEPFYLTHNALVRAATLGEDGESSKVAQADIRVRGHEAVPAVYYEKYTNLKLSSVPDFTKLGKPQATGYVLEFSLDSVATRMEDHFAVRFVANMRVEKEGDYCLGLSSDDGSLLYINDSLLIDNDGSHSRLLIKQFTHLTQGIHRVEVRYFEDYMGNSVELYIAPKGQPLRTLPFSMLERCEIKK